MNSLKKSRWSYVWIATTTLMGLSGFAQKENFISYLGAAWGPDGDTIYCIKQIDSPKRHFWLCKMNWDGSNKQDISELWPGQGAFVDTQSGALWLEVNAASSNIAFSVEFGNEVSGGLWIVGLDGKNQHRPFPLVWNEHERWAPLHPSWSPDGVKIVYEEDDRAGASGRRLVVYDLQKKERRQLTDGPNDQHPVWSPKGDWIAFTHNLYDKADKGYFDRRIWLIRPDGSVQRPILDEAGQMIYGWWPSWNPEGTKVSIASGGLALSSLSPTKLEWIDPLPILGERTPYTLMAHHWGKRGWLLSAIRLINSDKYSGRILAEAGVYKITHLNDEKARWGSLPYDIPRRSIR